MKNSLSSLKSRFIREHDLENKDIVDQKSTNINILLNRVKLDQKKESQKKIIFTAVTSFSVILFGILIF